MFFPHAAHVLLAFKKFLRVVFHLEDRTANGLPESISLTAVKNLFIITPYILIEMISLFEVLFQEINLSDIKKKYPHLSPFVDSELSVIPQKYLLWSAKQLSKNPSGHFAKELSSLVLAFDQLLKQQKIKRLESRDINTFKTVEELARVVMSIPQRLSHKDTALARRKARETMKTQQTTKTLRNDELYNITVPANWDDSCNLGSRPKSEEEGRIEGGEGEYWCISNPYNRRTWDAYIEKGVRFVFIQSKVRSSDDRYSLIAAAKWPSGTIQYTDRLNSLKNMVMDDEEVAEAFGNDLGEIEAMVKSA